MRRSVLVQNSPMETKSYTLARTSVKAVRLSEVKYKTPIPSGLMRPARLHPTGGANISFGANPALLSAIRALKNFVPLG